MRQLFGDVQTVLRVAEDLVVHGTLRAGATVDDGCTLIVHGSVRGSLSISAGGVVVIRGILDAFVDGNHGKLAVAGTVSTPVETVPGRFRVAAYSSVSVRGENRVVSPSGVLLAVANGIVIPLRAGTILRWEAAAARFHPVGDTDFRRLRRTIEEFS